MAYLFKKNGFSKILRISPDKYFDILSEGFNSSKKTKEKISFILERINEDRDSLVAISSVVFENCYELSNYVMYYLFSSVNGKELDEIYQRVKLGSIREEY